MTDANASRTMPRPPLRGLRAAAVGLAALCAGCAHVYVDAEGRTHAMGLLWLTLPAPTDARAGQAVRTRALGLTLTRAEAASSLVLGYQDTTIGFLRNHSLVLARDLRLAPDPTTDTPRRPLDAPPPR